MVGRLPYPPRLPLAHTPTPLEALRRTGKDLGVELYVKRDDLTGSVETGNKVRKLEFLLAEAVARGADTILTCGGAQSNHCRATAVAAARLGLRCRLLLRTRDPAHPPATDGNILLDRLVGAEIVWVTPDEYAERNELFARMSTELAGAGRRPYVIPEGGSNPLGAWGYVRAFEELAADLAGLGPARRTSIVYACGSGGTGAGLLVGARLLDADVRIVGVNVCDDRAHFIRVIGGVVEEMIRNHALAIPFERDRDIEIVDGYVGKGYAESRPEELALIAELARTEGIVLDPVYTGKAFFGLVSELRKSPGAFGERVVFLHTGGVFGLFAKAAEIAPLL
ncbi:MAG TPA: D-cysteine desulfhydrase family protein [Haliangiales bacterium]|nr:D-cysteine desulfhydrase family protein [Haliangiales bacterium]